MDYQGNFQSGGYAQAMPVRERRSGKGKSFLMLFIGFLIGGAVVSVFWVIIVILMASGSFTDSIVASDCGEFIRMIEDSNLPEADQVVLVEILQTVRDYARQGQSVNFWIWIDYDESIRRYITDRHITEREHWALKDELEGLKKATLTAPVE